MKPIGIFLALSLFVFSHRAIHAQNFLNGTAQISVQDENGYEIARGSGIVTGRRGAQVFVVTAYHVVEIGTFFEVRIKEVSWRAYQAQLHMEVNRDLDLAVLIAYVPEMDNIHHYKFRQANLDHLLAQDPVTCIGNPADMDWAMNKMNVVVDPDYGAYEISFTGTGIEPGFSGGPLLERKKNRLLGMVTDITPGANGVAVKIDQVITYLRRWNVSFEFLQEYIEPVEWQSYVLGGLAVGAFIGGVYYNSQGVDKYNDYENFKVIDAPLYQGASRESLRIDAKNDYRMRNYAYILSGVSVAVAIPMEFDWIGRKKKKKRKPAPPGKMPDSWYD
ncbi:MAG: trypsin-like peptidase domain-containing protein [Phaeodactylibacter sp.]|nr:trypsin-like peptidase domain-containing protein [Phaeodactylibacter sp.]MCB9049831.1 trypsin-like peptidase domain-containing protein [Lewinellaceae bacterium]